MPNLYVVGDSTLAEFQDRSYFYPRYGYATQLNKYFDIKVINLALSGRSSKSFILEKNYKILLDSIKESDYVLIGFGHNDEKDDDFIRFTDASLPINDSNSFQYTLYNYYIKPCMKVGAIPILATPIVRLTNGSYTGQNIHITKHGDYSKSIIELGELFNVTTVDLTTPTKNEFEIIGYDKACFHHAMSSAIKKDNKIIADVTTVDKAHLNVFGANFTAYIFAEGIKNSNSSLKEYLKKDYYKPIMEKDLYSNKNYKYIEYASPNLLSYNPITNLKCNSKGWYGTAFGELGVDPNNEDACIYAKEIKPMEFLVGCENNDGKIHASCDAFAYVFNQISINDNFEFRAHGKAISQTDVKQAGFGVMLRDDCYINQDGQSLVATNYIADGLLTTDNSTFIIFSRETTTEQVKGPSVINNHYQSGDEIDCFVQRIGQRVSVSILFNNQRYTKDYYDFDLKSKDLNYLYIGMYATRGTVALFTNVSLLITGKAKEA